MTQKDGVILIVSTLALGVTLMASVLMQVLKPVEALSILPLFVLVFVTAVYTKETAEMAKATKEQAGASRQMAEAADNAIKNSMHPVLAVFSLQSKDNPYQIWGGNPFAVTSDSHNNPMINFPVHNIGNGPALNIFVQPFDGDKTPLGERSGLLPLQTQRWLETSVILKPAREDKLSIIELIYLDVFGEWHETILNLEHQKGQFRVVTSQHKCHGPKPPPPQEA